MKINLKGVAETVAVIRGTQRRLRYPTGLADRLTATAARFYRGQPIPEATGRTARAFRQPVGGDSVVKMDITPSSWRYERHITVPYAPFQAHRIKAVPPILVRQTYIDFLTEGQEP